MIKKIVLAIALLAATFTYFNYADAAVESGKQAPAFSGKDVITGKDFALSDFKGKYVVLEWTNHDCPFVKKFYDVGEMQKLQSEIGGRDDVVWLTVVSSAQGKQGNVSEAQAKELIAQKGSKMNHFLIDESGTVGKAYGAKTTPHMYIVGKSGEMLYQGAIDSIRSADPADIKKAENYIVSAFKNIDAGAPIATSSTKPYGCSVKY